MADAKRRGRGILDLIAAFKFVKATTLVAAAAAALGMLNPRFEQWTEEWLARLALGMGPRFLGSAAAHALPAVDAASPRRLWLVALGALVYASVFVVEGVGLLRQRRWAEYLTVGVTLSFMPFEVVALVHRMSPERVATLVLNGLVVVYLVVRLRGERREAKGGAGGAGGARAAA